MAEPAAEQLHHFVSAKHEVASRVQRVRQWLEEHGDESSVQQAQDLLVKLAEDRFNLAVVGQFKRGKSTLINAIIGRDLLPTGLLPLTSAITTLYYGPHERVQLVRKGWRLKQEISPDELPDYVTEGGNPGNERGLVEAQIELPVPFLRRGLYFIDTPGIGSARQENTATTYAFLPEADAVIFVTSVEAPLSEAEGRFLWDIRQQARKLFVVVNKIDLLAQNERDRVLDYIRAGVARTLGVPDVQIYPVSARRGLEAKLNANGDGSRHDGVEELEAALGVFLAQEKSRVFLISVMNRALALLVDGTSESLSSSQSEPEIAADSSRSRGPLQADLEALRSALESADESLPAEGEPESDALTDLTPLEQAMDEQETLKSGDEPAFVMTATCPICAAQTQAVLDFFVKWQYAIAKEDIARRAHSEVRGFCRVHTWQFEQIAAPIGISEGYAPLVETVMTELRELTGRSSREDVVGVDTLLPTPETCPACRVLREAGMAQMARFIQFVATPEGQANYRRSLGLCFPHLRAALQASPTQEVSDFLLTEEANRLEEISEDMHGFVLKRGARRRGLLNDDENNAWRRALLQLAGERTSLDLP